MRRSYFDIQKLFDSTIKAYKPTQLVYYIDGPVALYVMGSSYTILWYPYIVEDRTRNVSQLQQYYVITRQRQT